MNEEQNTSRFKLGFKNFRKFDECPPIDISGATFLVGKNNSGKSTYVKGLLLMRDNFKTIFENCENICHPMFSFKGADAGVFTFGRALHRNAVTNEIVFSYDNIEIGVSGDKETNTEYASITYIKFNEGAIDWHFDFENQTVACKINLIDLRNSVSAYESYNEKALKDAIDHCEKIQKILANTKTGDPYYTQTTEDDYDYLPKPPIKDKPGEKGWEKYWEWHDKRDYFLKELQKAEQRITSCKEKADIDVKKKNQKIATIDTYIALNKKTDTTIIVPFPRYSESGNIFNLQTQIWKYAHAEDNGLENLLNTPEIDLIENLGIGEINLYTQKDVFPFMREVFDIEYIPAHDVPKKEVFCADDNNSISKSIHEYYSAEIKFLNSKYDQYRSDALHRFVQFWLQEFEIGLDFKIELVSDRCYSCKISNKTGEWLNISELGRGAAQLVLLLIRVSVVFAKHGFANDIRFGLSAWTGWYSDKSLIIIEEPEQNLHPALQSKLADFFCSLNREHGYHCLVETHSEYLIRRAQVIVGIKKYNSLDFKLEEPYYHYDTGEMDEETIRYGGKKEHKLFNINPFHVYYFPHDEWLYSGGDPEKPYEMIFREDGRFSNEFGSGFYDEATNLAFELM